MVMLTGTNSDLITYLNLAGYVGGMHVRIMLAVSILFISLAGCIGQPAIDNNQIDNQLDAKNVTNLSNESTTVAKNTAPYKNENYTLDKPVDWEVEENDAFTYFKPPVQENQTDLRENVVVYTKELEPKYQDLEDFFQNSIGILISTSPTFTILEYSEYKLGDVPAYKILYREGEGDSEITYLQVFAIKGHIGYIITYAAPAETFDKYLPEAETIMESYRLT